MQLFCVYAVKTVRNCLDFYLSRFFSVFAEKEWRGVTVK